jgi:hypothetical protein
MPLAFESINRGLTAFGFFNIDSDLLLLDHYFFFAQPFCKNVSDLAERYLADTEEGFWEVYTLDRREDIGDLVDPCQARPAAIPLPRNFLSRPDSLARRDGCSPKGDIM